MVVAFIEAPPSRERPVGLRQVAPPGRDQSHTGQGPTARGQAGPQIVPIARSRTRSIYRRRRALASAVAAGMFLVLLVALHGLVGGTGLPTTVVTSAPVQPAVARIWVVRPGDTLWTIALASGTGGDIRPLVDRLSSEVHGLPLQPGQRVLVP